MAMRSQRIRSWPMLVLVLGGAVAPALAARILCLPCSAHLTDPEQDDVIEVVRGVLGRP